MYLYPMKKFIRGFSYAFKGIAYATSTQINFRVELVCTLIVAALGFVLHISPMEWVCVSICIGLVVGAEMFNTAIEVLTDMVSPEWNEKAGHVKDIASGAVLVIGIFAAVVGGIIFLPKILTLIYAA